MNRRSPLRTMVVLTVVWNGACGESDDDSTVASVAQDSGAVVDGSSEGNPDTVVGTEGGDTPPRDSAPLPTGPCDLGTLPTPLDGELSLPALPTTTQEVEVSNAAEFTQAASQAGTKLFVRASIDERVEITASDVEIVIEDPAITVRTLAIGRSVLRARIGGGSFGRISTPLPAEYHPVLEYHEEYFAEDITVDGVIVDASLNPESVEDTALDLRGKRIAVYNSTIRGETYSVWSGDVGPFQSEDIVLACSTFRSHSPAWGRNESTVRLVSVLRSVVVDNTLQNSNDGFDVTIDDPFEVDPPNSTKHNYRIHGHSDLNFAARNILLNSGMMFAGLDDSFGTPPVDHIGRMWVNDNVFHHRVPDLFNPKDTIDTLVARGNVAYTNVWADFYGGTPGVGWDIADNQIQPYAPPPDGFLD